MGQTIVATLEAAQSATGQAWRTMLLSDQKQTSVTEPAQDVALLKQAVAAYRLGDKERARELLNTAAELNPENPLVWLWRASVAASYKEAVSSLDRVLELDPSNVKARQWMDKLQSARSEALRKAGIEVPEEESAARPTLVQPEERTETETATPGSEQALVPAESAETGDATPEAKSETADDNNEILDLIEEREQTTESVPAPERSAPETPANETSGSANDGETKDILAELMAGQQVVSDEKPADEADSQPHAEGLPAPIQPKSEASSATEAQDEFAYLDAVGTETTSESAPVADEEAVKSNRHVEPETEAESETAPAEEAEVGTVEETSDEVEKTASLVAPAALACPVCEQMWTESHRLCPGCGSLTELTLVGEAPRHDGADRAALRSAVKRLEEELEAMPTADGHKRLGLVYMNLRQSNDTLAHLREATRLDPSDQVARAAVVELEKRKLILAVDDSKTIQRMISSVLEKESYRVAVAADGLQALARLDEEMPSIMLLDITMPRMDGYQVCKVVTGNDATKHIPVIMLSGKDGFFDKVRGKMVGASNYITKPFDPSALLKAISKQIPS